MLIYVIEDDEALARGMAFTLKKEGYEVKTFSRLKEAGEAIRLKQPDAALLDWNLPDGDGLILCERVKDKFSFPILMVTARDLEIDQVMCLDMGADDYIAKPFSLSVLKARLNALLRRREKEGEKRELKSGSLLLDLDRVKAYQEGEELELSITEWKLLRFFLENKGRVLLKEEILGAVWDAKGNFVEENTLSVNIRRLRKKIEENPASPEYLKTVHGMGYLWEDCHE